LVRLPVTVVVAGVVVRLGSVVMVLRPFVRFMLRAVPRIVAMVILRRLGCVVAAARVVVVVDTPGSGTPVRHIATGVQLGHHIDGTPRVGVAVDRAAIGVAVNREAVGIVAGRCPRHRGGNGGVPRTVGEGAVAFIIFAGTAQQDNCCQECYCSILFHIVNR
jgi:hypothetical protein